MQSLPTEAGPLSHCSQCGKRVHSGSSTPTFVYGVGTVGHQSCAACGAKWRYLWKEPTKTDQRSRRPLAVIVGLLVIGALIAVAVVAFRGSAEKYGATTSTTQTKRVSVTTVPVAPVDAASVSAFVRIYEPAGAEKMAFMQWLLTSARATAQYDVNQRVLAFERKGRATQAALTGRVWPKAVAPQIAELVQGYGKFLDDVDQIRFGLLYSASYFDSLKVESQAVKDAATVVRHDLGLPPAP